VHKVRISVKILCNSSLHFWSKYGFSTLTGSAIILINFDTRFSLIKLSFLKKVFDQTFPQKVCGLRSRKLIIVQSQAFFRHSPNELV